MYTIKTLNNIAPAGLAKLGPAQFKVDNEAGAHFAVVHSV